MNTEIIFENSYNLGTRYELLNATTFIRNNIFHISCMQYVEQKFVNIYKYVCIAYFLVYIKKAFGWTKAGAKMSGIICVTLLNKVSF